MLDRTQKRVGHRWEREGGMGEEEYKGRRNGKVSTYLDGM